MVHFPQQISGNSNLSQVSAPSPSDQPARAKQQAPAVQQTQADTDQVNLKTRSAQSIVKNIPLHDVLSLLDRVDDTAKHVALAPTQGDKDLLLNGLSDELKKKIPLGSGRSLEAYDSGDLLAAKHHIERSIQKLRNSSSPDNNLLFAYSAVQKRVEAALYNSLN